MFYLIAAILIVVSLFFIYNAVSAFNELRLGIEKKVKARPYMVVLFFGIALILLALSYAAIDYQPSWEHNWNTFWNLPDEPAEDSEPIISEELRATINDISTVSKTAAMYITIAVSILFSLSLILFRKLSAHLFIASISFALITFICFIVSLYTSSNDIAQSQRTNSTATEISEPAVPQSQLPVQSNAPNLINSTMQTEAITQYLENKSVDVIMLSDFLKDYFKVPNDIDEANIDQLRQYIRGLTEIKQNLTNTEIPEGAENFAALSLEWINQELLLVTNCFAAKRETGLVNLTLRFMDSVSNFFNDKEKQHAETTKQLNNLRNITGNRYNYFQTEEEYEELKSYFSFIQ